MKMMRKSEVEEKLEILQSLYKADLLNPFPYDDCRKLLTDKNDEFEDLIPCLDLYFTTIAGYCSWGKNALQWSNNKIEEAQKNLKYTFFYKYPKFAALKFSINEKNTPKLHNQLLIHDLFRFTLLDALAEVKAEKEKSVELSLTS